MSAISIIVYRYLDFKKVKRKTSHRLDKEFGFFFARKKPSQVCMIRDHRALSRLLSQ